MALDAVALMDYPEASLMPDHDDSLMDQPVTRWHELRNQIASMTVTLAVIAERQTSAGAQGSRIEVDIQNVQKDLNGLMRRVTELEQQFGPVKTVVYGLIAVIVVAVIGALVALVVR